MGCHRRAGKKSLYVDADDPVPWKAFYSLDSRPGVMAEGNHHRHLHRHISSSVVSCHVHSLTLIPSFSFRPNYGGHSPPNHTTVIINALPVPFSSQPCPNVDRDLIRDVRKRDATLSSLSHFPIDEIGRTRLYLVQYRSPSLN